MATDYINEHELALMLSIGRNYEALGGSPRVCTPEAREQFDQVYSEYNAALKASKGEKRNTEVQRTFKEALAVSAFVAPTKEEIHRLYELLVLLSRRCLRTFGRNSALTEDELGSLTFEMWAKYRETFNPDKKSEITGNRVNAFAYMTQVIKNIIYGEFNKRSKEEAIEDLSPAVLNDLKEDETIQELEECRDLLLKESTKCVDFAKCLRNIASKYEIAPDTIIKTVMFFDLQPAIEENIRKNVWDF